MNPYLEALEQIPRGETRTFMELAAMAGRPGAARAAGRALASLSPTSKLPWHRVVDAQGCARQLMQLRRLRREGARPRTGETITSWSKRAGARFVGYYPTRHVAPAHDERVRRWNPERVEAFDNETFALARGFTRIDSTAQHDVPLPRPRPETLPSPVKTLPARVAATDWRRVHRQLASVGIYRLRNFFAPSECARILNDSTDESRFERSIVMLPRGYGIGSYHYYKEPLPGPAHALRRLLYPRLAPAGYVATLPAFWEQCRHAGQKRASSILIGYGQGGINHPHRDIYGPVAFPYQALIALSKRGRDFSGGHFYVADETSEGKTTSIAVDEGDVVIFATRERRADERNIPLRHGMTMVTKGQRYGLGLVFHLAE